MASGLVAAAVVVALAAPAGASAATAPPTVATSFPTNPIAVDAGLGDSTGTVVFTVANPNDSGTLYDISFTDTLPAGISSDHPVAESDSGCSSSSPTAPIVTWTFSGAAVTVNIPQVSASASCQVQFSIIGTTPGTGSDSYVPGSFTYSTSSTGSPTATATGTTPASIQVIPEPTVAVQGLKQNAVLNYGQSVKITYSCAQPALTAGVSSCTASDDLGNNVDSGGKLFTKDPGQHTLDVEVIDANGDVVDDDISYTILPDNEVTIIKATPAGKVLAVKLAVPGAGKLKLVELDGRHRVAVATATVHGKATKSIRLAPTVAGAALLGGTGAEVKLEVTFTPAHGKARTVTKAPIKLDG